jgi:glycosyltransferase involved in cell wall biosynthesis
MSNKRILIFSLAYYPLVGGAEVAVKEITDRISDIEFDMVTLRFSASDKTHEKIGNVNVYRIDSSKNLFPFKAFRFANKLHEVRPYDAVWAIMANWAGFAAAFFKHRFPNVKYILTLQEGDPTGEIERKVWFIYLLWKKIFLRADTIQTISHFLADWARTLGYKGRIEVIPNGVDTRKFELTNIRKQKENTVLISASRLVKKNGMEDVINALAHLPENVVFQVIGSGLLEGSLKVQVKKLKLENRVTFLGFLNQDEIPKYLHQADIFIRPSLSEGMGNSFIEAMAAGLPIIATPVGGIPDFLRDGETGLFCEVHNPQSICETVSRLITNPALKEEIITNAKALVIEKYDWNLIARDMKTKVFEPILTK